MPSMSHAVRGALIGLMTSTALIAPALADWAPTGQIGVASADALLWDPVDPKTLYAGGTNAVYVSHDMGATWTAASIPTLPMASTFVTSILRDPTTKAIDVSIGSAVLRTASPGAAWTSTALPNASFVADPKVADQAWMLSNNQVFRSANHGISWSARAGRVGTDGSIYPTALAVDAQPTQGVYVVSNGSLLKSTNLGASFNTLFTPLPQNTTSVSNIATGPLATLYAIVNSSNPYPAPATSIVAESTDGGLSWGSRSAGLPASALLQFIAVVR